MHADFDDSEPAVAPLSAQDVEMCNFGLPALLDDLLPASKIRACLFFWECSLKASSFQQPPADMLAGFGQRKHLRDFKEALLQSLSVVGPTERVADR